MQSRLEAPDSAAWVDESHRMKRTISDMSAGSLPFCFVLGLLEVLWVAFTGLWYVEGFAKGLRRSPGYLVAISYGVLEKHVGVLQDDFAAVITAFTQSNVTK
jgi:hypothetical protein